MMRLRRDIPREHLYPESWLPHLLLSLSSEADVNYTDIEPSVGTDTLTPNPTHTKSLRMQRRSQGTDKGKRDTEAEAEIHSRKERTCIPRRAGDKWTSMDSRS